MGLNLSISAALLVATKLSLAANVKCDHVAMTMSLTKETMAVFESTGAETPEMPPPIYVPAQHCMSEHLLDETSGKMAPKSSFLYCSKGKMMVKKYEGGGCSEKDVLGEVEAESFLRSKIMAELDNTTKSMVQIDITSECGTGIKCGVMNLVKIHDKKECLKDGQIVSLAADWRTTMEWEDQLVLVDQYDCGSNMLSKNARFECIPPSEHAPKTVNAHFYGDDDATCSQSPELSVDLVVGIEKGQSVCMDDHKLMAEECTIPDGVQSRCYALAFIVTAIFSFFKL